MVVRHSFMIDEPREQRTFVMQRTQDQIRQIEQDERIPHTHIVRMLNEAKDASNYMHNVYRHRMDKRVFEFRLHRTAIQLHSVTKLY